MLIQEMQKIKRPAMRPIKLEELSLEQKVGMVLTGRIVISRKEDFAFILEMIKKRALGAVQVYPSEAYLKECMIPVLETADYPILIGTDMERGCQLSDIMTPGNLALGATGNLDDIYLFAKITATLAKQNGYNMIWSPVVDLAEFDRPCTITRCFGSDKKKIAEAAEVYLRAFAECGVIGSAKHYPSAEDGHLDTHMAEETSSATKEELLEKNLYSYRHLINTLGDDMMGIMVGHTRCLNIDPEHPATLSKKVIGIARELGFNGLMITDSLAMIGIIQQYGNEKVHGMALAAGCDLILGNNRITLRETYEYMMQNFRDGVFSEERLNEAVCRVIAAQNRTLKTADYEITECDRERMRNLSSACLCEVKDAGVSASLSRDGHHLFVIDCENVYGGGEGAAAAGEIAFTTWWNPSAIKKKLLECFPNSDVTYVCEFPSCEQVQRVCVDSTTHDSVVYLTFCDSRCYQGTDGLTERLRILIESTAMRVSALLHFGNPYAIEKVVHLPRILFGFPEAGCVMSAIDILSGKAEAKGVMPVKLSLQ